MSLVTWAVNRPLKAISWIGGVAAVALVAVAILGHIFEWPLKWGNVATWLSAASSAAVVVTLAVVTHRRSVEDSLRTSTYRTQAISLTVSVHHSSGPPQFKVELSNKSGEPIHLIRPVRVSIAPVDDLTSIEKLAGKFDGAPPNGTHPHLSAGGSLEVYFVPDPTQHPDAVELANTSALMAAVEFTDVDGNRYASAYPAGQSLHRPSAVWVRRKEIGPADVPVLVHP